MSTKKLSLAALWSQRLDQWKASGKSAAHWSRENEVSPRMLFYWRDRFSNIRKFRDACRMNTLLLREGHFKEKFRRDF